MGDGAAVLTLSRNPGYVGQLSRAIQGSDFPRVLVNHSNRVDLTQAGLRNGWAVLEPGCNQSYSVGNNLAADAARGAWGPSHYLLLNDDCVPAPGFLEKLWGRRNDAELVGALLLEASDRVNHAGTYFVPGVRRADHLGRGEPREKWESGSRPPVQAVTFAAVLVRADLFHDLGGLSERYWYGFEDTDFCLRALQAGATIRCARDAVAHHGECGTRPRGGKADQKNYKAFWGTWGNALPGILRDYAARVEPEEVQGGNQGT